MWGALTLMLELGVRSDEVLARITAMWADISNSLQIFEVYKDFIRQDAAVQEVLFDVLVDLLLFTVVTIQAMKLIRFQSSSYQMLSQIATWSSVKNKSRDTSERLSQRISYIKEKAEAIRITNRGER
ncbi:MAG: hypothetical protein LQ351_006399 [Letrouitia transgressa]|nr:MAG: hypothetical protein LQ351_006399 [Letrouitia transgressa]